MSKSPYIANITIPRAENFKLEGDYEGLRPKSIVVHADHSRIFIDYGGLDGRAPSSFTVPRDAKILKRLARVLAKEAQTLQDLEDRLAALDDE